MKFQCKYILMFITLLTVLTYSQQIKLYGTLSPGNLIVGKANNAKIVMLDNKTLDIDTSGIFIFGFDRDAKVTHTLKVIFNNNKSVIKKIKLKKRKYKIQRINKMKQALVTPPKNALKKIKQESKMMRKARSKVGILKVPHFTQGFLMPVNDEKITGVFGSQRILNGIPKSPHNGIDLSVPKGTPVKAASGGKILIAGNKFYYNGNFVLIDHGFGLTTVYLHFNRLNVKTGQMVKKGDIIGYVGATGRATGPHLHWGAKWFNKRIDPMSLLKLKIPDKKTVITND